MKMKAAVFIKRSEVSDEYHCKEVCLFRLSWEQVFVCG